MSALNYRIIRERRVAVPSGIVVLSAVVSLDSLRGGIVLRGEGGEGRYLLCLPAPLAAGVGRTIGDMLDATGHRGEEYGTLEECSIAHENKACRVTAFAAEGKHGIALECEGDAFIAPADAARSIGTAMHDLARAVQLDRVEAAARWQLLAGVLGVAEA